MTSPSTDLVVLALDAELADVLGLRTTSRCSSSSSQWITSARMKPRWKSVWMRPAHCGRLRAGVERPGPGLLLAGGEERAQAEQVVGGADHAEQRALAEPEALEHLGPLGRVDDGRRLGLELHAHADDLDVVAGRRRTRRATRCLDLGDAVELVLADVDDGEHRPVGEQEVRREQLALLGLEAGAVERRALATARRTRPAARRPRRRATCRAWTGACAWFEALLDGLEVGEGQLDLDDAEVLERVGRAR